jgi:hypothetical protein
MPAESDSAGVDVSATVSLCSKKGGAVHAKLSTSCGEGISARAQDATMLAITKTATLFTPGIHASVRPPS